MMKGNMMAQQRRASRKVLKVLSFGVLVVAVLAVAHFVWKYSGSNKWELMQEKNGVKVYALKAPGSTRKQFKGVIRLKTTLNRVVTTMTDTTTAGCRQFVPGCVSGPVLKPWDSQSLSYIQLYRIVFKRWTLISPRELVGKAQFSQDPRTKVLLVECTALPDMIPPDPCCVRMRDMTNTWRFTPLGHGELELEWVGNYDPGIPYWIYNFFAPRGIPTFLPRLQRVYNKEKYGHTEFAFIKEG
jgi:hypothetical protein